jgi:anti-anti-sigma factor
MVAPMDQGRDRTPVALNVELSHGRHGAAARFELHDRGQERIALVRLAGWIDTLAAKRLSSALEGLSDRGATQLLLDCSQLRHIDYRLVPALVDSLAHFEAHAGGFVVCGLSRYLRDLFRLADCETQLRCWPSAADLLNVAPEPCGETAS